MYLCSHLKLESAQTILSLALNHPIMQDEMELLQQKTQTIPGSVQYVINRYRKLPTVSVQETGLMIYNYAESESDSNLELVFCIAGNRYCKVNEEECSFCKHSKTHQCEELVDTIDVACFRFNSNHLSQFVKGLKTTSFSEDILNFNYTSSFSKELTICNRTRGVLDSLMNHSYTESLENIFINAQTQMLLLYSMDCMTGGECEETFSCKFLENEADREKISLARKILLEHIGEPLTIKELSRKAAINECYLKKGFKEMYGTTIFDFFQSQRMEHAKYLLYEKGLTVTDVSSSLGYSSISHFSTAFKKHTGIKPCELLFR